MRTRWTKEELEFVRDRLPIMAPAQIANALGRSESAVAQAIHRYRIDDGGIKVQNNLLLRLLGTRFRHLEDFRPSPAFFKETGISAKRFWALYRGERAITSKEYVAIAEYFYLTIREAMATRQLDLFEQQPITPPQA